MSLVAAEIDSCDRSDAYQELPLSESCKILTKISRSSKYKTCTYYFRYLFTRCLNIESSITTRIFKGNKRLYRHFMDNKMNFSMGKKYCQCIETYLERNRIPCNFDEFKSRTDEYQQPVRKKYATQTKSIVKRINE